MKNQLLALHDIGHPLRALIAAFFLYSCAFWTEAQGTVDFRNKSSLPAINAPVTDARTGLRVEGSACIAQLYYTEGVTFDRAALRPAEPSTHFSTGGLAGYIIPVDIVLSDVGTNAVITVQMRAWNTAAGSTYEQAAVNPLGVIGESNILVTTAGGGGSVPGEMEPLYQFSVYPVPEPKPLALLIAGLIAIFLPRRILRYRQRQS